MSKSRRNFIKNTITAAIAIPTIGAAKSLSAKKPLTDDQKTNRALLNEFETWVDAYVIEIRNEKNKGRDFKDNRALVDLPDRMEEMMPKYKARFKNSEFLKEYVRISQKLSQEIDINF